MSELMKLYRLFNILSLDVAAGAVIGSLFFAKIYNVVPATTSLISLGLTVWIIYTVDRLLDVRVMHGQAASARHRFHQKYQKTLFYCLSIVVIMDMALLLFMPLIIMQYGILLSLVVLIYILLRRRLHVLKEFFVAALYTSGVVLPAWPESQMSWAMYLPILLFFLIALINLIIFSLREKENDLKDQQDSLATLVNEQTIRNVLTVLFITTLSISFYILFLPASQLVSLVFMTMIIILFLIFWYKNNFTRNEHYRLVGDAVFLLPLIYVVV